MSVTISPLARPLHNLTSLLFLQPLLSLQLLMHSVNLTASRTSRSPIYTDTFLFDSRDPALLAGLDDNDDNNTSLAGVQGNDTSLAGVKN